MPLLPRPSRRARAAAGFAALALPLLARAHPGTDAGMHHDALHALVAGFLHPLTGPDHLLAMLALGAWSVSSARRVWSAPFAFLVVLAIGALGGAALAAFAPDWNAPNVEPLIAASLLAFALLLTTRTRLGAWTGVLIAGVFALGHGLAHGRELAGEHGLAAIVGLLWSSTLLLAAGGALGRPLRRTSVDDRHPASGPLARGAGAALLVAGIALVAAPAWPF